MKIPEIHKSNNRKYYFVKQYPNFVMYQTENGIAECFSFHELGMIEELEEQYGEARKGGMIKV